MIISQKSIYIIDYEGNQVVEREIPAAFEAFVAELISHISSNNSVREYKTRSNSTEVISSILSLSSNFDNHELVSSKMIAIARRLLLKESEAQERISRTRTNVQKGSLIQVLIQDDNERFTTYLLAKVEHSEWVDDTDFSFKTGFSKDKKNLWKSCLVDISNLDNLEFHSKVYSNTVAKYWSDGFLEFDELNSDEYNTLRAFRAIDATLNQNFKGTPSPDHTVIRNHFIGYFKNNDHIDYPTMVNSIIEHYKPIDREYMSPEKVETLRAKLLNLPENKKFDSQFTPVNDVINARIRKVYPITDGIDLKVNRDIHDLSGAIQAVEENGVRYIRVRTDNESTYRKFQIAPNTPL